MPETREAQSVIDAAEQAAATGDYASAEQLLREAALLQEASLGPLHPDLANTLNNLGVVCEITDKPVDAEQCFRRASAIASAVLEPDHPFVATSRKNLEDFCAARGKAVDSPSAASIDDAAANAFSAPSAIAPEAIPAIQPAAASPTLSTTSRNVQVTTSDELPPERPSFEESQPVASRRWSGPFAIGALIAGGLLLTFMTATWFRSNDQVESSAGSPSASPGSPATTTASPSVGPSIPTEAPRETGTERGVPPAVKPVGGVTTPTPATGRPVRESPSVPTAAAENRTTPPVTQPVAVATAQLCRDLSTRSGDWRCVAPTLPVGPGPLVFYTRVKSSTVTTVQHRWYRDDRLRQAVELPIRANTTVGYRTYSRQTVDNRGAGDWRVELRTKDGVLLHEERFVVR